ncbi:MAG: hypothetical protein NTV70_25845 [Acidobacteria bacterium]|nr:hypothetical protein [Acidobacteriota bacterium]
MITLLLLTLAADLPSQREVDEITRRLGEVMQLKPRRSIPVHQMTRDALKRDFARRADKVMKPEEQRVDELTLQWLGFVAPGFNLKTTTVDLLSEQAAAFYDYRRKRLVMLANPLGEFDPNVLAHELSHALADQHFKIGRFIDGAKAGDDAELARQSVVEGQASWLMADYESRQRDGTSVAEAPGRLPAWSSFDEKASFAFPELEKAPLYLRVNLLFPYWEGGRFQQAVLARSGPRGFREVFTTPPVSSQQILHPEAYFENRMPEQPALPLARLKGYRTLSAGVLGEADHLVLFKQYGDPHPERVAEGWRGGQYRILERRRNGATECCVVLYSSSWKDEAAAEAAEKAWARVVANKPVQASGNARGRVSRQQRNVISIEGLSAPSRPE